MTRPENTEQRFLTSFVPDPETGCWLWTRPLTRMGYGRFYDHGYVMAHRVMYERVRGPIPVGLTIDHLCRRRNCVNPWHLEPVTLAENVLRGYSPAAICARKTHCLRGHPLSGDNLLNSPHRICRTCHNARYIPKGAVA
jgi:hypothetical protein